MNKSSFLDKVLETLDRYGLKYELDSNPSPERIEYVKALIAKKKKTIEEYKHLSSEKYDK